MNRNALRKLERELNNLSPETFDYIKQLGADEAKEEHVLKGVQEALRITRKALHTTYGFGKKRLARLEKSIHTIIIQEATDAQE